LSVTVRLNTGLRRPSGIDAVGDEVAVAFELEALSSAFASFSEGSSWAVISCLNSG
jgi:hypothetical protein